MAIIYKAWMHTKTIGGRLYVSLSKAGYKTRATAERMAARYADKHNAECKIRKHKSIYMIYGRPK